MQRPAALRAELDLVRASQCVADFHLMLMYLLLGWPARSHGLRCRRFTSLARRSVTLHLPPPAPHRPSRHIEGATSKRGSRAKLAALGETMCS